MNISIAYTLSFNFQPVSVLKFLSSFFKTEVDFCNYAENMCTNHKHCYNGMAVGDSF